MTVRIYREEILDQPNFIKHFKEFSEVNESTNGFKMSFMARKFERKKIGQENCKILKNDCQEKSGYREDNGEVAKDKILKLGLSKKYKFLRI